MKLITRPASESRCTRFFQLEPCALGSGLQESFPSFLDRLAAKHQVPVEPFLRMVVYEGAGWRGFGPIAHLRKLLIGQADAHRVVDFVAAETAVDSVRQLVSPFLRDYLLPKPNLRGTSAWCPECLAGWAVKDTMVYRPLIWSIAFVELCPVHWCPIELQCPHCRHQVDYFGLSQWSGHCHSCGSWLAGRKKPRRRRPSEFERHCAISIAQLVASQTISSGDDLVFFRRNLELVLDSVGVNQFCRLTGFSKETVKTWRRIQRKPQMGSFLRLSYCFGGPLIDWVSKQMAATDLIQRKPFQGFKS